MLLDVLGAAQDLGRVQDLTSLLIRYGFGDLARRLGLGRALENAGRLLHWAEPEELARLEPPQRIRRLLEDMGPSFVKLGQILATRIDLLPQDYIDEFCKLQDRAPPLPFDTLKAVLEQDLGAPLEELFAEVDPTPVGAASLSQVHLARLKTGARVVLKIRRPGVRKVVEADLRLLKRLAEIAESRIDEVRRYRPIEIAAQFSRTMRRELDLAAECRNAERVAENFADDPTIVVPKVYWRWTSERLNVQQFIDGIPGRDLASVEASGLDRKLLARRGGAAVLKMVFEDGFFHADPHQGNVFFLPGNRVAFIDFGMVGRLSEARRRELVDLLQGFVERNPGRAVDILLQWAKHDVVDEEALTTDVDALIDSVHSVPLKSLNLPRLINDLVALLREHNLALPSDLALLTKAFISLEGMGRQLDPDFDMMATAEPFLKDLILARYSPKTLARRSRQGLGDMIEVMSGLPADLRKLVKQAQSSNLKLRLDVEKLGEVGDKIERGAARLALALVTSALILGSSIAMTASGGRLPVDVSYFAMFGFLGAMLGGVWIILSIWRGR
ncbi:2-octaprenylphenol hydroxylase [Rhodoblastus acidophilus]|uniref:2-octaprenylphenol hydroxylase n=1 Tax=Rhodoblastus acidophilus TaxID=1074 RepID=A0A212Q2F8_RHOAC|nr:AarF/UbiB family protein [Rhodoblastus acidophilus]MCW2316611.1 ubiquinone biosynthesis protein [Rhodoblastus acidophilus]PPQ37144.1 ubiquinone biosynthesis protein UbiB [Rhodoblastus acidophilus]RAI17632.1 ubiquinone biosynthesis protein UbiB [Rhodoblastus acidophilus]SNB53492.1 2-octaprenylphenol hydroxylase [Rhodoblastus acidophilus]